VTRIKTVHLPSPFFTPGGALRVRIGGPFGPGPFGSNGPFAALLILFLFVVVIAALALLVTFFIRRSRFASRFVGPTPTASASWRSPATFDALRILDERFARGEIDAEDYRERRDLLQSPS
jgi:putative membrane protein